MQPNHHSAASSFLVLHPLTEIDLYRHTMHRETRRLVTPQTPQSGPDHVLGTLRHTQSVPSACIAYASCACVTCISCRERQKGGCHLRFHNRDQIMRLTHCGVLGQLPHIGVYCSGGRESLAYCQRRSPLPKARSLPAALHCKAKNTLDKRRKTLDRKESDPRSTMSELRS